jgi:sporulation protein YlmC with PRC-barrel domain
MPSRSFAIAALLLMLAPPVLAESATSSSETMKPGQVRASKLIGKSVWSPDGRDIGDVADLILDKEGRIERVVVSVGGFLGVGDKQVAVPIGEVRWGAEERLTLDMTRDQLAAHPRFLYDETDAAARTGPGRLGAGSASPRGGAKPGSGQ